MKTDATWQVNAPAKDQLKNCVFDLAFRPDGGQLLVACGNRILVYDAQDGEALPSLKGHRDYVYCVAYSRDGKRFASGGADKTIIIWTSKCEGILKYTHNDSIQCLAYNPVTQQLASATASDFGLWSPEQKSVQKFKVSAKVLSAAWTNDGQYLALGQFNGHISVRDKNGNEKVKIERKEPIWTLAWSPQHNEQSAQDTLAVGCWDKTLSFYLLTGAQIGKDRALGYDPCSLCYYCDGEYLVVGGSDRKVTMYTKDGVPLKPIADRDDWVWAIKARPKSKYLAVGGNDGTTTMYQTVFSTVHGLYQDRYAHRDTMTDVIIQHLITEQKVRIKTRDYVKKIAVYRARLAVQLPDRVLVYETENKTDAYDMHYRLREKVMKKLDCNLLVVTAMNIILCQEKRLQLYNFKGRKIREWVLEAVIRYIRVVGGPSGREGLLVGLKNGAVFKIFIDNRFPVRLIKHAEPIRCLDLSASRKKLAVVDEKSNIYVYDLTTQQITFQEANANSVAWNTDMEEMFCYSGGGQLCIKTGDFPIHKQPLQGFVVGFKGSKIFCLHYLSMQTIDVPQSASLYRYLDKKDYDNAYAVACLGVTESDWRELAMRALIGLSFDISRKAFIRIRDVRFIELLNRIEIARKAPSHDDNVFLADILAYQGSYSEAARLYCKANQRKRAIEMYLDLRDWNKAKEIVEQAPVTEADLKDDDSVSMLSLLVRQAEWLAQTNDWKGAAQMYWAAKDYTTAINIMGEHGWLDDLIDRVRAMNKLQRKQLTLAADYFRKHNHIRYAKETYIKMDDIKSLMDLYVESHNFEEAELLCKQHPEFERDIFLPKAEWLAVNDRFDEAQAAFRKAGRPDQSLHMLEQLTHNAVVENRYNDAGFYYWLLANENLKLYENYGKDDAKAPKTLSDLKDSADVKSPAAADAKDEKRPPPTAAGARPGTAVKRQPLGAAAAAAGVDTKGDAKGDVKAAAGSSGSSSSSSASGGSGAKVELKERSHYLTQFYELYRKAELYYAYHFIYRYTDEPFTSLLPDALFQTAQYILNNTLTDTPHGVSKVYSLYALAKQGKALGAFKLAREAYNRLLALKIPNSWKDQIDMACLTIRTKPYTDKDELLPVCYRCSTTNALLNKAGDVCVHCGHPFVRSYCSFETLPLVQFYLEPGLTHEEAMRLLDTDPESKTSAAAAEKRRKKAAAGGAGGAGDANVMTIGGDGDDDADGDGDAGSSSAGGLGGKKDDAFQHQLVEPGPDGKFPPIRVDAQMLLAMRKEDVFVRPWPSPAALQPAGTGGNGLYQYFRSIIPEVPITMCKHCRHFFHSEDFEFHVLQKKSCPFCRAAIEM